MFSKSDEQLIKKAIKGNKHAWFSLLSRYEKAIYNYGIRMTGNTEDAKDLMQDVFISVYRNLANYNGTGAFKSWLFRIAHFRCIEFYRRKKPHESLDDVPEMEAADMAFSPELKLHYDQRGVELLQAMQRLPLNQKAVIELKFFSQFTFDEIAEQLDISANTVKSRLYAALAKLKTLIEVDYV